MAAGVSENSNAVVYVDYPQGVGDNQDNKRTCQEQQESITLYTIFNRLITAIFVPNNSSDTAAAYASSSTPPLLHRIKAALSQNIPLLRVATKNTARLLLIWARRGSPLRPLLVVSVGTFALLALTECLVFMFFFAAATVIAIVISLLVSLAAAGGFLAIFFAFLVAIYIGALSVAVFVISATTISAIIATVVTAVWIGFFFTIWLATQKGVSLAKQFLSMTGSVVSAYSSSRFGRPHCESNKSAD